MWSRLFEGFTRYAEAVGRELVALSAGRSDADETLRRLADLSRDHLERLATPPRRGPIPAGLGGERDGARRRRAGRIVD